jgi:hypothetical protein
MYICIFIYIFIFVFQIFFVVLGFELKALSLALCHMRHTPAFLTLVIFLTGFPVCKGSNPPGYASPTATILGMSDHVHLFLSFFRGHILFGLGWYEALLWVVLVGLKFVKEG